MKGDNEENQETQIAQQRAEDVAYTINHAFACTATDIANPFIGNWTQRYLGKRYSVGCGQDHEHEHGHGTLGHWLLGEAVGDFAAVPATVALQRHAPRFMAALRKLMEPVLGPFFRAGAQRESRAWAMHSGFALDSAQARDKAQLIYAYEMEHLPQAVVWTASSSALNIATQKLAGNRGRLSHLAAGKLTGSVLSAALVVGGRMIAPDKAHRWDSFAARKLFMPATRNVSELFGVNKGTVDAMEQQREEEENASWGQRVKQSGAQPRQEVR